jgi:hypothetical protein
MEYDEVTRRADSIWKFIETSNIEKPDNFMTQVEQAEPDEVLRLLIARLGSTGATGARWEALRDATNAVMSSRLSTREVAAMDRLNASTTRLMWVGIGVSIVGVGASLAQTGHAMRLVGIALALFGVAVSVFMGILRGTGKGPRW